MLLSLCNLKSLLVRGRYIDLPLSPIQLQIDCDGLVVMRAVDTAIAVDHPVPVLAE
jgi:hypothetical protein